MGLMVLQVDLVLLHQVDQEVTHHQVATTRLVGRCLFAFLFSQSLFLSFRFDFSFLSLSFLIFRFSLSLSGFLFDLLPTSGISLTPSLGFSFSEFCLALC